MSTHESVSQQPVRLAQETVPDVGKQQTILRRIWPTGPDKVIAPQRALILLPVLTALILAVLWITILEKLRVEKDAALNDARRDAYATRLEYHSASEMISFNSRES